MPNENIIESIVYPGSQSVTCRIIYQLNERIVKLEIKSDGFAPQSYAKASVFDGTSWKDLYAIPYALMRTPHELFYSPRFCGQDYKNLTDAALQLVLDEFSADLDTLKPFFFHNVLKCRFPGTAKPSRRPNWGNI
mgnify:CR=1 FL=1